MIDKVLLKKRFLKSLNIYDKNAAIQKIMASNLLAFLTNKNFKTILEIGCGTGILTKLLYANFPKAKYTINDIVAECEFFIDDILENKIFISADIEKLKLKNKYDLIISNATLQWCENFDVTTKNLITNLNKNGILIFSIFGQENLKEIKTLLNVSLNYPTKSYLKTLFNNYNTIIKEDVLTLEFESALDVLKHLKNTGVNSVAEMNFTKSKLQNFEKKYTEKFFINKKYILTYNPIYVFIKKD